MCYSTFLIFAQLAGSRKNKAPCFFQIKNWVFLISDYELCKITKRIGGKYHEFQPPLDLSKN